MNRVTLRKNADRRLKSGHLWVFSNELVEVPDYETGSIVEVLSHSGKSIGFGFYNPHSLIAVRLLGTQSVQTAIQHGALGGLSYEMESFFYDRLKAALELRLKLFSIEDSFRLVFGESDFLPGLIVDKYSDYLSIQTLSAGMEKHILTIIEALLKLLPNTKGIIEKNTSSLQKLEGLPMREGVIYGSIPDSVRIEENGIKYDISLYESQKTGYFLDQKFNRLFMQNISKGARVLDCFTNQGGFAFNSIKGGAEYILGIDSSESAIEQSKKNAELNGFNNVEFVKADVFDFLQNPKPFNANPQTQTPRPLSLTPIPTWDIIILDPPAFAKSRKDVPTAKKGYAKLNRLAMQALAPGGLLVSSSCSQHIMEDVFVDIIKNEAMKLGRNISLIYRGMQSPDHPIHPSMPETKYLKFFVLRVGENYKL